MTTRKEIVEWLEETYRPNDVLAVAIWTIDDVIERANDMDITLTKNQAENILERIDNKQSADVGINWDIIDAYINDYLEDLTKYSVRIYFYNVDMECDYTKDYVLHLWDDIKEQVKTIKDFMKYKYDGVNEATDYRILGKVVDIE